MGGSFGNCEFNGLDLGAHRLGGCDLTKASGMGWVVDPRLDYDEIEGKRK